MIALEEIQDNNGATNDGVVDANVTLDQLVAAIAAAGGPAYQWRQINPVDNQDGGEPGGNIRVGFLFRTDRGLAFVDRPGGNVDDGQRSPSTAGPVLSVSPGRIDPTQHGLRQQPQAAGGRVHLPAADRVRDRQPLQLQGWRRAAVRSLPAARSLVTEVQRHQQAQVVNDFVDSILAVDGAANVVVLGDINDFEFSDTVSILKGGVLHNLIDTLPPNERYSYVFEGNSQVLDHILVSNGLRYRGSVLRSGPHQRRVRRPAVRP